MAAELLRVVLRTFTACAGLFSAGGFRSETRTRGTPLGLPDYNLGGFEYQLWHGFLLEVTYIGSHTNELQVVRNLNYLTTDKLALGTAYLNTNVPNPFFWPPADKHNSGRLFGSPNTSPTSPLFGSISKAQINLPRECEIALRYRF